jgi:hypothetical protein
MGALPAAGLAQSAGKRMSNTGSMPRCSADMLTPSDMERGSRSVGTKRPEIELPAASIPRCAGAPVNGRCRSCLTADLFFEQPVVP